MAGDPKFFLQNLFSWTCSSGRVKKIQMLMFKIPDFSLAPRLCKQAGLNIVSARKDFDPRTLVSEDFRHFNTTVRCAAHYAGVTLRACLAFSLLRSAAACLRSLRRRVSFDTEVLQPGLAIGLAGTGSHWYRSTFFCLINLPCYPSTW